MTKIQRTGGRLAKVEPSSLPPVMVGHTDRGSALSGRMQQTLGIDYRQIGNLDVNQVAALSRKAKDLEAQVKMGDIAAKAMQSIIDCTVKVNQLRAQIAEQGMAADKTIAQAIGKLEVQIEKHLQTLAGINQSKDHGVALAQAGGKSSRELADVSFRDRLTEIYQSHHQALAQMGTDKQQSAAKRQMAAAEREKERALQGYMKGEGYNPFAAFSQRPAAATTGRARRNRGSGLFS